jgi:osmoprotectant transport system ATP-binding protein
LARDISLPRRQNPRMATGPLIELVKVAKSFDGGRSHALNDVSLRVEPGAFIALVGTSGSGKTTALKTINRLAEPDRGEVRFDGTAVESLDAPMLRRRIGYVFQGIGLFPHMTIAENIAITPQLLGWTKPDIAARVAELLDLVELPRDYAARLPDALSGGQRQRIGVARAIAARPRVMLMDEPFGALDPVTRDTLGSAYRALHARLGMTTVMVTHDMQEAVLLADRIVVMSAGRIVADDTPGALMTGHASPEVAALMEMPRRQAERIHALMQSNSGPALAPGQNPHG